MSSTEVSANPLRTFHWLVTIYVLLLCGVAISSSGLVKLAANSFAIVLLMIVAVNWMFLQKRPKIPRGLTISLCIFYAGMLGSVLINYKETFFLDVLKIAMAPIFLVFGVAFTKGETHWSLDSKACKFLIYIMVFAPLSTLGIQMLIYGKSLGGEAVRIFVNPNNAGLYAVTLLAFITVLQKKTFQLPIVYMCVGIMFGTLGLFLAVIASLFVCNCNLRVFFIAPLSALLVLLVITAFPEVSKALRVQVVIDSIELLVSGRIDLATVTYAELVQLLHTSDLSFLFRLKHWYELIRLYANGTLLEWLFGFGSGASVRLTSIHLVPHNDYLRMLFEFGTLTLIGFIMTLALIISNIRRGGAMVPFLAVVFYFWSENIIHNYIAMVLFFFSAGAQVAKESFINQMKLLKQHE